MANAKAVSAALKKGSGKKATRVHTKVHFYKPKTLTKARALKALSVKAPSQKEYETIKFPLTTESAMKKVEENNTLVFIVDIKANKKQIKAAVKKLYDIKAQKVNTLIRYVEHALGISKYTSQVAPSYVSQILHS
jgi:large subunit ribosomal protein L23Ae